MNTVTVNASKSYNIYIGSGLLNQVTQLITEVKSPCKIAIITDSNVKPLYANTIVSNLDAAGYESIIFSFAAGESSKNASTYLQILNFLAENKLTRSDLIIALGGGVVGDIAGFAAATYLRGIAYIQIPTTLLAMVDSSVGGKTAIDLEIGKNLVGAFYQPSMVICDTEALKTLPNSVFTDGCAEVIKYGILYDEALFAHLEEHTTNFNREYVITSCIEKKRDVVTKDEYDTGDRQMLNLGHTFGHSIEAVSNFAISHGNAVAIGINIASKAGIRLGICTLNAQMRIESLLGHFNLPISTVYDAQTLYKVALSDKKRFGDTINLIIPKEIGCCILFRAPIGQLKSIFEAGL